MISLINEVLPSYRAILSSSTPFIYLETYVIFPMAYPALPARSATGGVERRYFSPYAASFVSAFGKSVIAHRSPEKVMAVTAFECYSASFSR